MEKMLERTSKKNHLGQYFNSNFLLIIAYSVPLCNPMSRANLAISTHCQSYAKCTTSRHLRRLQLYFVSQSKRRAARLYHDPHLPFCLYHHHFCLLCHLPLCQRLYFSLLPMKHDRYNSYFDMQLLLLQPFQFLQVLVVSKLQVNKILWNPPN